jgi:hypothetical protein
MPDVVLIQKGETIYDLRCNFTYGTILLSGVTYFPKTGLWRFQPIHPIFRIWFSVTLHGDLLIVGSDKVLEIGKRFLDELRSLETLMHLLKGCP